MLYPIVVEVNSPPTSPNILEGGGNGGPPSAAVMDAKDASALPICGDKLPHTIQRVVRFIFVVLWEGRAKGSN